MASTVFDLSRDPYGKLVMVSADGEQHIGVSPVRAFPIQAPHEGISLMKSDGKEVAWIDHLDELPEPARSLIREELEGREFMPEIARVKSISSFATPCTWYVDTDRGETEFVLKGEEDIRRIGASSLLIADNHGIQFLIRDMFNVDKQTKKILDRFL